MHHHEIEILQFVDFQDDGCLPSWNFEIEILNKHALHVVRDHFNFCGDQSYCCRGIAIFHIFLVKCKNSLDDCV